jgi:outer membrane receptor protein involved in Fe transport
VGVVGLLQRDFRGERSGREVSFLRTWFIQHEFRPNDKFNIIARAVYRETGMGEDSYLYVTADGRRMIRLMIASHSRRAFGEAMANYSPSSNHHFSAGLQVSEDNVEAGARGTTLDLNTIYLVDGRDTVLNLHSTFLPRKYDIRDNWGGYLQYVLNTNFFKKTNFTIAARYDNNSYFGDALSPRFAIVTQPSSKLTFKLQYGHAFRAPTNLEIHQPPPSGTFKLKKERNTAYEANAIYRQSKNFRFQLNLFKNELKDVIILSNLTGFTPNKNPGEINIWGLEGVGDFILTKNVSGFANWTFQDARGKNLVTGDEGKLPGVARFKANGGITLYVEDIFTFTFTGNYVGERRSPRTDPYGTVAGYFLGNCMLSAKDLLKKRITASLSIRNIFNSEWLDPGFRTADGFLYATVLEQPGINALFKIGINF